MGMKWGIDHEMDAVSEFEKENGRTTKCGLFIHKKYPYLGATPDRIWRNKLLEIKCSYVLRDVKPDKNGIGSLDNDHQRNHCLEIGGNGPTGVRLKRTHPYFKQCQ